MVERAGQQHTEARLALEVLLMRYLAPLRTHLVFKMGVPDDRAEELVQGFIADKVLERDLIGHADQTKGKFRTFLLTSLDRYVIDRFRREKVRSPSSEMGPSVDVHEHEGLIASKHKAPEVFDVAWAREVLGQALRRMQSECEASSRPDIWGVFESRIIKPIFEQEEPLPYGRLVELFGFRSPLQAANVLTTAKRMFQRTLRALVNEYVGDDGEIDLEIQDLKDILSHAGAG